MTGFGVEDFLLRTGKACPVWTLTDDSNVIGFGESRGVISIAAELIETRQHRCVPSVTT